MQENFATWMLCLGFQFVCGLLESLLFAKEIGLCTYLAQVLLKVKVTKALMNHQFKTLIYETHFVFHNDRRTI
jgi:hypothetical protein